jgi:hypothetical protein
MPLKLSLFSTCPFSPWNGRGQYWFVLVFSHGFLVVYTFCISHCWIRVGTGWSMKDLQLWIFPIFRMCLIVRTHPPRLGRSWAFFSSFFSSVKRSCRLSTKFALSQKCVRGGPKAVRRRVGSPVMGTWRENSNLSQKIGGSVSCHSLVNAGIENRWTKTGVGLGSTNEAGVNKVALNSVLILLRVTSYKMILWVSGDVKMEFSRDFLWAFL